MTPDYPSTEDISGLRRLWQAAFGDTDEFLDLFFSTAYAPDRCRCIREGNRIAAALYWLDFSLQNQKIAYIYAVATDPAHRGRGLCRTLMEDTDAVLTSGGYAGAILVPQDAGLRTMYAKMGYLPACTLEETICTASVPCPVEEISPADYLRRRVALSPAASPEPGEIALNFLSSLARFYAGDGFLAAVSREQEHLRILEYLGNRDATSALVAALGASEATLRLPGAGKEFAMYRPLVDACIKPEYYPFAFD